MSPKGIKIVSARSTVNADIKYSLKTKPKVSDIVSDLINDELNWENQMESDIKVSQEAENKKSGEKRNLSQPKKKINSIIETKILEKLEEYDNSKLIKGIEKKEKKVKNEKKVDDLDLWRKINIKSIIPESKIFSEDLGINYSIMVKT